MCAQSLSPVQIFATPWTVAFQAPQSMGFPRQECWSGLPFPSPRDLCTPGREPVSHALAGGFFPTEPPGKPWVRASYNRHAKVVGGMENGFFSWQSL